MDGSRLSPLSYAHISTQRIRCGKRLESIPLGKHTGAARSRGDEGNGGSQREMLPLIRDLADERQVGTDRLLREISIDVVVRIPFHFEPVADLDEVLA